MATAVTASSAASKAADNRELVITRVLHAPIDRVWKTWTEPKLIEQWFGPRGFSTRVEEHDFSVGGKWNYVMVGPDGNEYPCHGIFREIVPGTCIVSTDEFEEDYDYTGVDNADLPSGMVVTTLFEIVDKHTTRVTIRIMHASVEDKQKHEKMGVVGGWQSTLDCFEENLIHAETTPKTAADTRLVIVRTFNAPIDLVWRAWTETDLLRRWHFPKDFTSNFVESDARVGGKWRESMRSPDGKDYVSGGVYREVVRPHRLVFTHVWEKHDTAGHESLVTISLSELDGQTTMIFEQNPLVSKESRDDHREGWNEAFDNLGTVTTSKS